MATLEDLKSRIASELNRSDLTAAIAAEIPRAIERYAAKRFWFNEGKGTSTATAGQETVAAPEGLRVVDVVFATIGGQLIELCKLTLVEITDWLGSNAGTGQPTDYAYTGDVFYLYRVPNAAYTITAVGIYDQPALDADSASNAWTTHGEDLICYEAAERLARVKMRNSALANEFRLLRDDALRQLRAETARRLQGTVKGS
jgi:hypothetical protein